MKKKLFTALLTAATILSTLPMTVFSANETFEPKDGDKVTVVASAIVTEDELEQLGLDLVISIPTEITLSLNGKTFEGSGEIYAYGVMDNDKLLRVNIDETHEDYEAVYFHETPGDNNITLLSDNNFNGTVEESLSNTSFTHSNTTQNYIDLMNGDDFTYNSVLSVKIKNLIPCFGVGEYFTRVPLVIEIADRT